MAEDDTGAARPGRGGAKGKRRRAGAGAARAGGGNPGSGKPGGGRKGGPRAVAEAAADTSAQGKGGGAKGAGGKRAGAAGKAGAGGKKPPVKVWRIHLGAHKTATTHLQQALVAARPGLRTQGVDFIPLRKLREAGLPAILSQLIDAEADRPGRRRALAGALRPLRGKAETVAFSEENLIGLSAHLLRGPNPYPGAGKMVRWLGQLGAGGAEVKLFFAIRSFDALAPSAYAESMRRRHLPGGFDAVRKLMAETPPSWVGLIDRLRKAAPKAELRVWLYEDYAAHARELATLFLGVDPGELDVSRRPQGTATPSAAAVAEAEALPRGLSKEDRAARSAEIYARLPASGPETKFNPFTDEERARLRARYAQDLDEIERRHPGVLVRFA